MRRRQVLAGAGFALASVVAGCIAPGESNADATPTLTDTNRYTDTDVSGDTIDCDDRVVEEWYRNDVPPQPIEVQPDIEPSGDTDAWNSRYLGKHIAESPSLSLARVDDTGLDTEALYPDEIDGPSWFSPAYFATAITSEAELERVLDADASDGGVGDAISPESVDFDESLLVFVKAGSGSSSRDHRWVRAEATDDGIHLYGYLTSPYIVTSDLTPHTSLLEVERPDHTVESVGVSYTERECRRINFTSEEGSVTPLSAWFKNATEESVTAEVTITAGDDTRVDHEITVEGRASERVTPPSRYLGVVADPDEALTVSVAVPDRNVNRQVSADAGEAETVAIRLKSNDELGISFTDE